MSRDNYAVGSSDTIMTIYFLPLTAAPAKSFAAFLARDSIYAIVRYAIARPSVRHTSE